MTRNNLDEHLTWLLKNAGITRPSLAVQQTNHTGTATRTLADGAQLQGSGGFSDQGNDMRLETGLPKHNNKVPSLVAKQRQLPTPASVTSGRFEKTYSEFLTNSR